MYSLYFMPGACSLATQVIMRELNLSVELINRSSVADYQQINASGTVPVLQSENLTLKEGAAIVFYLLDKYPNNMMPTDETEKAQAIENILFANASMHPAYSKLFFVSQNLAQGEAQTALFEAAASRVNLLWQAVEQKLGNDLFLGGNSPSAADILLAVYQRWGEFFPVDIVLGPKAQAMVDAIHTMPNFQISLAAEAELSE